MRYAQLTQTMITSSKLPYFDERPLAYLIHGKTHPAGIAFIIEADFPQRGIHVISLERLADLNVINRAGFLYGIQESYRCRIGIEKKSARFGTVGFSVGFNGRYGQGIFRYVSGARGVDTLGILAGHLEECFILYTVIGNKKRPHILFTHLAYDQRRLRMVTAKYDPIGLGGPFFFTRC